MPLQSSCTRRDCTRLNHHESSLDSSRWNTGRPYQPVSLPTNQRSREFSTGTRLNEHRMPHNDKKRIRTWHRYSQTRNCLASSSIAASYWFSTLGCRPLKKHPLLDALIYPLCIVHFVEELLRRVTLRLASTPPAESSVTRCHPRYRRVL